MKLQKRTTFTFKYSFMPRLFHHPLINQEYNDIGTTGYPARKIPITIQYPGVIDLDATVTLKITHRELPDDVHGPDRRRPFTLSKIPLNCRLIDPKGDVFTKQEITLDDLNKYRNARGFLKQPWYLDIAPYDFRETVDITLMNAVVKLSMVETIPNSSAPPLVEFSGDISSFKEFKFDLFRVGKLEVFIELINQTGPAPEATIKLIKPDGSDWVLKSGLKLKKQIQLQDLSQSRGPKSKKKLWKLRIEGNIGQCKVFAQVYETVKIPGQLILDMMEYLLGNVGTNLEFRGRWDDTSKTNRITCVIKNKQLAETFGVHGILGDHPQIDHEYPAYWSSLDFEFLSVSMASIHGNFKLQNVKFSGFKFDIGVSVERRSADNGYTVIPAGIPRLTFSGDSSGEVQIDSNIGSLGRIEIPDFVFEIGLETGPNGQVYARCWYKISSLRYTSPVGITFDALPLLESSLKYNSMNEGVSAAFQKVIDTILGGVFTLRNIGWSDGNLEIEYTTGQLKERTPNPKYSSTQSDSIFGSGPSRNNSWNSPPALRDPDKIKHIVVIMMENRSFDHVLGYRAMEGQPVNTLTTVNGLSPEVIRNFSSNENPIRHLAEARFDSNAENLKTKIPLHVGHTFEDVKQQLNDGNMNGFVGNFVTKNGSRFAESKCEPYDVLGYYTGTDLPMYKFLADEFAICDEYYSSHPGPTLPNRFYLLAGDLDKNRNEEYRINNNVDSSFYLSRSMNLFDILSMHGVSWRVYESPPSVAMLRMFTRYAGDNTNIRPIDQLADDINNGDFPSVVFIEPAMHHSPPNDDHPPSDMLDGQYFIKNIYESLKRKKSVWDHTMMIITYDEHGGFFDHVKPPFPERYLDADTDPGERVRPRPGEVVSDPQGSVSRRRGEMGGLAEEVARPETIEAETPETLENVDVQYGVRVPTFVVSPYVDRGAVFKKTLDHASIVKTILVKFCGEARPFLSDRVERVAGLGDILKPEKRDVQVTSPELPGEARRANSSSRVIDPNFEIAYMSKEKMSSEDSDFHDFIAFLGRMVKPH